MGFLGLFGKKKTEEEKEITPPSEDKKSDVTTTTSVDENASFEIPDFSEEDLDFDLGVEDFVPEEQSILEESQEDEHKEFRDYFKFEESQDKIEKPEETDFNLQELEEVEELPLFDLKSESSDIKEIPASSKNKIVFLERIPYTRMIALSKKINVDVSEEIELIIQTHKTNDQEIKIHEELKKELDDIQHDLLYIDQKLFG